MKKTIVHFFSFSSFPLMYFFHYRIGNSFILYIKKSNIKKFTDSNSFLKCQISALVHINVCHIFVFIKQLWQHYIFYSRYFNIFFDKTYSTLEPISISSTSKHWITFSSFTSSTGSISGQLISGRIERKI